jgi:hypothetical protein
MVDRVKEMKKKDLTRRDKLMNFVPFTMSNLSSLPMKNFMNAWIAIGISEMLIMARW